MALNFQQYYAAIAAEKRSLDANYPDGYCRIVSVYNLDKGTIAGSVAQVTTALAAKGIIDGVQRLLTPGEETAREAAAEAQRRQIATDERARIRARVDNLFSSRR